MSLSSAEVVTEILRERPNTPLTAREISELIRQRYPAEWDAKQKSAGRTDNQARNQVVAEINSHRHDIKRKYDNFTWYEEPRGERVRRKFAWALGTEEEKAAQAEAAAENVSKEGLPTPLGSGPSGGKLKELDLYPLLANWLLSEYDIRCMRLHETKTPVGVTRSFNWNRWLFPDVVGVQDRRDGWHSEFKKFADLHGAPRCRLWSFEVKLLINRANVRDCYLQAVSNSSWAHRAYLVAAEISSDDVTRDELALLVDTHGVGVIELNANDALESEILLAGREKPSIDWQACERLYSANQDFQSFIKKVLWLHQTDELPATGWLEDGEEDGDFTR